MNLGLLVEGHGEHSSVPILVRRIAAWLNRPCVVRSVLRQHRSLVIKAGELERAVRLLADKVGAGGSVLVLLDGDDDAACTLGPALLARARAARPDRRVGVVLAVREYEAWFLAAARSLAGRRGLPAPLVPPADVEAIRDAKGWLDHQMPHGYAPTIDQPALTAVLDLEQAMLAPSFDKLVRELKRLLG